MKRRRKLTKIKIRKIMKRVFGISISQGAVSSAFAQKSEINPGKKRLGFIPAVDFSSASTLLADKTSEPLAKGLAHTDKSHC